MEIKKLTTRLSSFVAGYKPFALVPIAPLAVFRILFGAAMVGGVVRFVLLGWIHEQYVAPKIHFAYYGFEWMPRLHDALQAASGGWSIYAVFGVMFVAAFGVMLGAWFRASAIAFFLAFTFVELIDKTYYLNHYYFVSLVALLLCFVPAHAKCSLDIRRKPALQLASVPRWTIDVLKFQLALVYLYAGLAKMTHEWLFLAMPLRIWLPANDTLPIIGTWLREPWMAYVFSWAGMLYDTTIVLWLLLPRTRFVAYGAVVVFHLMTGLMFQIGVFPLVMIALTPIFFSPTFHQRCIDALRGLLLLPDSFARPSAPPSASPSPRLFTKVALTLYVAFQVLFPWRCVLYDGNMLWTEEGYRFGWRVMLMEKAATATLFVRDASLSDASLGDVTFGAAREGEIFNREFLNAHQEKQMAMQPDMILQFAHFVRDEFARRGMKQPHVRAEVYTTLNGRPSRLYIDSSVNLAAERESFAQKTWVLPWRDEWSGTQRLSAASAQERR